MSHDSRLRIFPRMAVLTALVISPTLVAAAAVIDDGGVFPLAKCPITGEKIGSMGSPVIKQYDGREVRFCCPGCPAKFEADKAANLKKIDAEIVKQEAPLYPLTTCMVTGNELGDSPVNYVYKNRLIEFCCPDCIKQFDKEPAKYLAKLDEAVVAKQKPAYPLDTCLVTGKKLGPDAIDVVLAGRLIRVADQDAVKALQQDPPKYLAALEQATKASAKAK